MSNERPNLLKNVILEDKIFKRIHFLTRRGLPPNVVETLEKLEEKKRKNVIFAQKKLWKSNSQKVN